MTRVIDNFTQGDRQFLVMDFVAGQDLWELLEKNGGAFSQDKVLEWARQLLDVLDYLHKQAPPVIHRDIKPQNLKLTKENRIVLLDFGLSKGLVSQKSLASNHSIFGYTPNYASLEQIQGSGTDQRSDLYSLGATLYHLVTGFPPIHILSRLTSIMDGHVDPLTSPHDVNPHISTAISNILKRSLAIRRDDRFVSAAEMRAVLGGVSTSRVPLSDHETKSTSLLPETIVDSSLENSKAIASTVVVQAEKAPAELSLESAPKLTLTNVGPLRQLASDHQVHFVSSFRNARNMLGIGLGVSLLIASVIVAVTINRNSHTRVTSIDPKVEILKLKHTLKGHTDKVKQVVFSSNGKMAASYSNDKSIISWDTESGALIQAIGEQELGDFSIISISPNGKHVATLHRDKFYSWDAVTGELKWSQTVNSFGVLSFSPDGEKLATGGEVFEPLMLWQSQNGELINKMKMQGSSWVGAIAFSPDDETLAYSLRPSEASSKISTLRLCDVKTLELKRTFNYDADVTSIAFSPDGRTLATTGWTSKHPELNLWDVETGKLKQRLAGEDGIDFLFVSFSSDGNLLTVISYLLSGDREAIKNPELNIWELQTGQLRTKIKLNDEQYPVGLSLDGKTLATTNENEIQVWEISNK
jgi:serine/threonine protein kinase